MERGVAPLTALAWLSACLVRASTLLGTRRG
jgi:hypothetical protein